METYEGGEPRDTTATNADATALRAPWRDLMNRDGASAASRSCAQRQLELGLAGPRSCSIRARHARASRVLRASKYAVGRRRVVTPHADVVARCGKAGAQVAAGVPLDGGRARRLPRVSPGSWARQARRRRRHGGGRVSRKRLTSEHRPHRGALARSHRACRTPRARGQRRGSLNAKSSPAYCAPLIATTRYCSPFSMYVIGEPLCGAGM